MKLSKKENVSNQVIEPVEIDKCLAKTEKDGDSIIPGMTVEEHCILSGYVSNTLARMLQYLVDNSLFPKGYDTVVALHDIGKISSVFQWNIYKNLTESTLPSFVSNPHVDISSRAFSHTAVGQAYVNDVMRNRRVGQIVADHHGMRPNLVNSACDSVFGGIPYNEARKTLQEKIEREFGHIVPSSDSISEVEQLFLTGLTVISDWISSARNLSELDCCSYKELAEKAVSDAGFESLSIIPGLSFEDVFGFSPRYSQSVFCNLIDKPGVYVLEVEMGQGKTEAALYAAYKLLENGMATGIYFALPTRLTSVAIYKRVESFLKRTLRDPGKTRLIFQNSELYDYLIGEECSEGRDWFDSSKRSILYPFGVGTIDQALMSVINVKHSALRAFGLAGKVLIIDELHSYDVYTGSLVRKLIKLVTELKGTVIVLSATLQDSVKNQILGTSVSCSPYPLASCLVDGDYRSREILPSSEKKISLIRTDREKALDDAVDRYYDGQNVLWIENTVEEAQNVYRVFVSRIDNIKDVGLIHSRFTQEDRQKHEDCWLKYFGKEQEYRKRGAILVGTQVLEQSLDIDADVLFTALAPVDMLLQRMGRLWRHPALNKYRNVSGADCYIISPSLGDVIESPDEFGLSGCVYSPYVLFRTLKAVDGKNMITIPADIRKLIDSVYTDEVPENGIIAGLLRELKEKKSSLEQKASYASSNIALTESDDSARTRVSDIQTVSVLILKKYDYADSRLEFLDGSEYSLEKRNSRIISQKILRNEVRVGIDNTISAQSMDYLKPLKPFTYISESENERLRVVEMDSYGKLGDVFSEKGEKVFYYSENLGYIVFKERNYG